MSGSTIHTALNVPSAITEASPRAMQWSDDGQLFVVTRSAIYILTPDLGINFDTEAAIRAPISLPTPPNSKGKGKAREEPPYCIGWYRTMIEFDRPSCRQWMSESQEWSTVSLGIIDPSWLSVTCSPSNLTASAGCYVAALNTNLEASLWCASKNFLKGEWHKVHDITAYLLELPAKTIPPNPERGETAQRVARALHSQIHSVAWSSQVVWSGPTTAVTHSTSNILALDGSLLALGNRAGCVLFMRLINDETQPSLQQVTSFQVGDSWVVQLAWTPWAPATSDLTKHRAYVACAISDGSVFLVQVTQTVAWSQSDTAGGGPTDDQERSVNVQTTIEKLDITPSERDGRCVTALQWVQTHRRSSPILVICKPGLVYLYSDTILAPFGSTPQGNASAEMQSWTGSRKIRLGVPRKKVSVGVSAFANTTGVCFIQCHDALLLSFVDGRVQVVQNISTEPIYSPDTSFSEPAKRLIVQETESTARDGAHSQSQTPTKEARDVFICSELSLRRVTATKKDVNRITGLQPYNGSDLFVWLHDSAQPTDFSYKSEANQASTLIVAPLLPAPLPETIVSHIREVLSAPQAGTPMTPLALLRPVIWYLRERTLLQPMHAELQGILRAGDDPGYDDSMDVDLSGISESSARQSSPSLPVAQPASQRLRQSYKESLRHKLFDSSHLLSLRLRLSLSDHCWKLTAGDEIRQEEYGIIAQGLHTTIFWRTKRVLLQTLMMIPSEPGSLSADDVAFIYRVIVQCMLPGVPTNLQEEAQRSLDRFQSAGLTEAALIDLDEQCPACASPIPPEDSTSATCPNGHIWMRCSITSVILSTPMVRTCVGCTRKALLPPSQTLLSASGQRQLLPEAARCWLVEDLLASCPRCLFCGNAFTRLL